MSDAARERPRSDVPSSPRTPEARSGNAEADPWAIPDSVKDRFTRDGHRFYFPDGTPAFRDHGRRLTTTSENTQLIASLIEIAKARGWTSITVGRTARFRAEAWKQAQLAGLQVRGYTPSEVERAALIRALARRDDAARDARAGGTERTDPMQTARVPDRGAPRTRRDGVFVGKLLDHGAEHYQFDPKADTSYFVQLETAQGQRVLWGTDLERALKASLSQPRIGDEIVIRHRKADPVTVVRRKRDESGRLVSETQVGVHRNTWSIERADFLAQRASAASALRDASLSARHAIKNHPELAGTLLQLKAAELASRRIRDPGDRETFVEMVRHALAEKVARGEELPPVRLKTPRERGSLREQDRAPIR